MKTIYLLPFLLLGAGCASPSQQDKETPPPKANRVQVLTYDDDNARPPVHHLDVYALNQEPSRPYRKIALLTCEGRVDQEVVMTQAIYYRARMLGAEGVIDAGAIPSQTGVGITGAGSLLRNAILNQSDRCVFRDYAIIYTQKSPPENINSPESDTPAG